MYPWCSTKTTKTFFLLKFHSVSRYTRKCNFICALWEVRYPVCQILRIWQTGNSNMCRSLIPSFTRIDQGIWNSQIQIYLRHYIRCDSQSCLSRNSRLLDSVIWRTHIEFPENLSHVLVSDTVSQTDGLTNVISTQGTPSLWWRKPMSWPQNVYSCSSMK